MLDEIVAFGDSVKRLRTDVKNISSERITTVQVRKAAETIGSEWCNVLGPKLKTTTGLSADLVDKYTEQVARLITLSAPRNRKSSYLKVLDFVVKNFRKDIVLPIQQGKATLTTAVSAFDAFLSEIAGSDEGEYFKEALSCAKQGYFRAAAVMGWCTAIDRIHRKLEEIGLAKFNVTSAQMASQSAGRFKRFNQTQNVNSLSELREVFDSTILWIIEGMGLIDSNQHTRLRSCFEMRCQAAHPGDAPTTEYNLLSFFSDIDQIVLRNTKFLILQVSTKP